ncbi:Histidine kinase [Lentibacillus sp. JNUCC-1]|uniref:ATP-binding protein n=1 Tax=Lentibacillus sp. JNUCC-1 TaxID=2654513 RepID=UPI001321E381|nr:ATP-binding protein [Lentibacillus sp. JNUCC-1]MUV39748.1 Histidine kinase [Lentibacillus sp. JNUCC-1]
MFWRSVVGKLAITILLLVSFVLFVLTILMLEFFENFHIQEAEEDILETANKISTMVNQYEHRENLIETVDYIKDPSSRVLIRFNDEEYWLSETSDDALSAEDSTTWIGHDQELNNVVKGEEVKKQTLLPGTSTEIMVVGTPIPNGQGAVYVYQSLAVIDQTKAETTKIIFLAAGIAIILTTIFAFFLSTRITSPLIKMREAAFDLTRGEFNTKVPILTNDEIGGLAMAFNRMGRQLKFHINALRQEKEQMSSIISSMADGVMTLNRNGNIIVTNAPAEHFLDSWYFDKNEDQFEENQMLPEELKELLTEVVNKETEVMQEINLQGRTWVMIMTPLYNQTYVRGAVAVIRDMTDERRLDKLRKDFIANVSHELRTPIAMMQGYSEAIVDDVAESKEDKNELAEIIHEESLRMGRLVNELLDLARMEAGHIQLDKDEVNLDKFFERIMRKFRGLAEDTHIDLTQEKDIQTQTVMMDADKMEQVLTNLIDNAIRHTSENGEVKVIALSHQDKFTISVKDNGSGIPEDDLPFVFERFYKADKARTRNGKKKGTGLGLSIAKHIVEAHRGSITVNSKLGEGTTFTIKIPN